MSDEEKYLTELSKRLDEYADRVHILGESGKKKAYEEIRHAIFEMVQAEKDLRKACKIGVRFNIIRNQLQSVLDKYDQDVEAVKPKKKETVQTDQLAEGETIVYVYLFNSRGSVIKNWERLLAPRALVDHSVNRPIYAKEADVQALLRSKSDLNQHAYLAVIVNQKDILRNEEDEKGHTLLRLRQGSLHMNRIKYFTYKEKRFSVSEKGINSIVGTVPKGDCPHT